MKQIASLYHHVIGRLAAPLHRADERISARIFYVFLAAATFFLVITAQLFWSTIHGDGAVYAWIVREIGTAGFFTRHLPAWDQSRAFAEHPYLFFYFSSLFTSVFGYSDLALKIPNFVTAFLSLALLWHISARRGVALQDRRRAHAVGLMAGYVLVLNSTYIMQISQPSLDPLAQLLALAAATLLILHRRAFTAGLLLGLAFLTKGLEMLPHLAAIFMVSCWIDRADRRALARHLLLGTVGVLLPLAAWLGHDQWMWNGQWLATYWQRQFTERFFHAGNTAKVMHFGFLQTFLQVYAVELIILAAGTLIAFRRSRAADPFFLYFLLYVFFNTLAFLLIKKDSSQHLTGVLLFGAVFVAEHLWSFARHLNRKVLRAAPVLLFGIAFGYWSWFMLGPQKNPDMWTAIKTESAVLASTARDLPIVVQNSTPEGYGFFYTVQWYFPSQPVYSPELAARHLVGRRVLLIADHGDGRLRAAPVVYGQ